MTEKAARIGRTEEISDLRGLAKAMDSQFKFMGFRFGWDGIVGLVPVFGDLATSMVSLYILIRSAALGTPPVVLARMGLNILVDNFFSAIPIFGQIFDFIWKSNNKNVALLDAHLQNPTRTRRASWLTLGLVLLGILVAFVGVLAASVMIAVMVIELIRGW